MKTLLRSVLSGVGLPNPSFVFRLAVSLLAFFESRTSALADITVKITGINTSYTQALTYNARLCVYPGDDPEDYVTTLQPTGLTIEPRQTDVATFVLPTPEYAYGTIRMYATPREGTKVGASYVTGGTGDADLVWTLELGDGGTVERTVYLFDPLVLPDGVKTVWATDDTTLTANLFREGVDKIIAQSAGGAAAGGSGGTGSTTNTEALAALGLAQEALKPTLGEMSDVADTYGQDFMDALDENVVRLQGETTATAATSNSSFWVLHMPIAGGGNITIDVNPLSGEYMAAIYSWIRLVFTVILIGWFEWWAWGEFSRYIETLATVPQARGNTVAGTGGQITGLVAAGLVATVLVSIPAAYWAVYSGAFSAVGVTGGADITPDSNSPMIQAFWFFGEVFPLGVLLAVWGQVFIVRKAGLGVFTLASITIRAIVPALAVGLFVGTSSEVDAGTVVFANGTTSEYCVTFALANGYSCFQYLPAQSTGKRSFPDVGSTDILYDVAWYDLSFNLIETSSGGVRDGFDVEVYKFPSMSGSGAIQSAELSWPVQWARGLEYFMYGFTLVALWELGGLSIRVFKLLRKPDSGEV